MEIENKTGLQKLRDSDLFSVDFPKRKSLNGKDAEEGLSKHSVGDDGYELNRIAVKRLTDVDDLDVTIYQLGTSKFEPAITTLGEIWTQCAHDRIRLSAGHALCNIATDDARSYLIESLYDFDDGYVATGIAVRALFETDPKTSFDRLKKYFDSDMLAKPKGFRIAREILSVFAPSGMSKAEGQIWRLPDAPNWFRDDLRWSKLVAKLVKSEELGDVAENVLRNIKVDDFEDLKFEVDAPPILQLSPVGDLVSRYEAGEYSEVWELITSLGQIGGDLKLEVDAVAVATMQRVLRNLELLADRFADKGWVPKHGEFRTAPTESDKDIIAEAESVFGYPVPSALLGFWQVIGGMEFHWDHDSGDRAPNLFEGLDVRFDKCDPLCIYPPEILNTDIEDWEDINDGQPSELQTPPSFTLAPDYLHKANMSGGDSYRIDAATYEANPIFESEEQLRFVEYLRYTIGSAGFAKLKAPGNSSMVDKFVQEFTAEFEEF